MLLPSDKPTHYDTPNTETPRIAAFIFNKSEVDKSWLKMFGEQLKLDPEWITRCADAVQYRYSQDPVAQDGYARIGNALMSLSKWDFALPWYSLDWKLKRLSIPQMFHYIELILHLRGEQTAIDAVEEWYKQCPDAKNGFYSISQYFRRCNDSTRARIYLLRDWEEQRLVLNVRTSEAGEVPADRGGVMDPLYYDGEYGLN